MADPQLHLDLDPRHGEDGDALVKLLLLRRAYRIISDLIDDTNRSLCANAGIEVMIAADFAGDAPLLPAGPTAILVAERSFAEDLAQRAGGVPVVRVA